ncbi:hypothetical protein L1049_023595 [Liquidambar formosana]|uniref:BHLH domain-containing protein n=1 Tax=Liquidambar formosana TaxID=63359 RepID=A0AAP0X3M6_LIQFO
MFYRKFLSGSAMNHCISDWNIEGDLPVPNQKKPLGPDHELVELLWRNGQVVLHSQTHRKPGPNPNESRPVQKHDQPTLRGSGSHGYSSNLDQYDETVSWIHYPLEDSLEKEFCSNFFMELPSSDPIEANKPIKQFEDDKLIKFSASNSTNLVASSQQPVFKHSVGPEFPGNPMPPPRFQIPDSALQNPNSGGFGKVVNFSQFSVGGDLGSSNGQFRGKEPENVAQGEVKECSVMTIGSSHCGSNQVGNELSRVSSSNCAGTTGLSSGPVKDNACKIMPQCERGQTEMLEPTGTSSSGGSGSSFGRTCKQSTGINSHKRKGKYAEDSECQSETAELESAAGNKTSQRSGSSRKSRAAEVHNLSERRRRDRINEKMKALQELIPHCNKSDKASMLDEAIEYLKSLQLQLQMMWMGSGMAPMMFPGVQHYMSRMGMGMGPSPLPSIHNPMHLPRVPVVDQSLPVAPSPNQATMCQTPVLNPVNYQNQIQNPNFSEQYARYMGFHHMQTASQPMNMFNLGTQTVQPSHPIAMPGGSTGPRIGGPPANDASGGKF